MMNLTTDDADGKIRLDQYLAAHLPELSRSRIQALIKSGDVQINGSAAKPKTPVSRGDSISVNIPEPEPAEARPQDIPLDILYEDEDVVVINKESGMVVHPAAGNPDGTIVNALLHHCGDLSGIGGVERPGIVHRLDKDTSGCLVIAKNDGAHQSLTGQFAARSTEKRYPGRRPGNSPPEFRYRLHAYRPPSRQPPENGRGQSRFRQGRHHGLRPALCRPRHGLVPRPVHPAHGQNAPDPGAYASSGPSPDRRPHLRQALQAEGTARQAHASTPGGWASTTRARENAWNLKPPFHRNTRRGFSFSPTAFTEPFPPRVL